MTKDERIRILENNIRARAKMPVLYRSGEKVDAWWMTDFTYEQLKKSMEALLKVANETMPD